MSLFWFFETIGQLAPEPFGKSFISREPQFDLTTAFRNIIGSENIIPDAKTDAKIYPVRAFGNGVGMVI